MQDFFHNKTVQAHTREQLLKFGMSTEQAEAYMEQEKSLIHMVNDEYHVIVRRTPWELEGTPLIHLSIKRHDREPIDSWRIKQEIKNKIVGEEHEAVELYPAESRLVDTSNQYHLWVMVEAGKRLSFGYTDRLTKTSDEAESLGAKQRAFSTS